MAGYVPHTKEDVRIMLDAIGIPDVDTLFSGLPEEARLKEPLDLPEALSETELLRHLQDLADTNRAVGVAGGLVSFLGAGVYDHATPAAVDELTSRQEFYTAYTPYQPEISQGTLQALFEYQTQLCALTGMDVSNASLYDGASACLEACRMAVSARRRRSRILISEGVHPHIQESLRSVLLPAGFLLDVLPLGSDGRTAQDALASALDETTAGVLVQSPNYLGFIEDLPPLSAAAHEAGALFLEAVMDALSLALLASPGESGADIVAGSGQVFAGGLSFGGPYLGFLTARKDLLRRMPGRIVGQTTDVDGRRAFVLTLQTREQHIRRDKATSNVCSNHSLYAVRAAIHLALTGPEGLREVALESMRKARRLERMLLDTGRFERIAETSYFREFPLRFDGDADALHRTLLEQGFLFGKPLPDGVVLLSATEKITDADLSGLEAAIGDMFTAGGDA